MSNDWIDNELETVDLNDKRLDERFADVLNALGSRPNVSIPAACGGHTETMAAYRFFENPKTTFEKIIKPHQDATEKRISGQEVILCVQDTTELDLTRPRQQIRGAGLIGTGTSRRGADLHLLYFTTSQNLHFSLCPLWLKFYHKVHKGISQRAQ